MKKVLLISTRYFDYPKKIKNEFEANNVQCDLVYETHSFDKYAKQFGLKNLFDYLYSLYVYFLFLNKRTRDTNYDEVLMIRCENISVRLLKMIEKLNCRKTLYEWDSIKNLSRYNELSSFCDRTLTFDIDDATNFNIAYRSLFFSNEYLQASESKEANNKYDVCFVGSWHKDRNEVIEKFKAECNAKGLTFYTHLYMSFFLYVKLFLLRRSRPKFNEVTFKSLTESDIVSLYHKSKMVLDIHSATQSGFTMRTFEALAAGCLLITTNNKVQDTDFNNSCLVISRETCELSIDEISKLKPVDDKFNKKYSLTTWVKSIFSE